MNRHPSRFRPCLEALEERSLLAVNVTFNAIAPGVLDIDARQSKASITISISNNGNGHVTADISGDDTTVNGALNGPVDFFNVRQVNVEGGPGGAAVSYSQQGDAFNPSGDQVYGLGLYFQTGFEGGNNTYVANLNGHALRAGPVTFAINGGSGNDNFFVNARGVDIGLGVLFSVGASGYSTSGGGGTLNFSMDYSGVKRGKLEVVADGGTHAFASLRLDADFLGASTRFSLPWGRPSGVAVGDLEFDGGTGNNSMTMLLFSPGGLPVTGEVFGGAGQNSCLRTNNVSAHGCQQDRVFGVGLGRTLINRAVLYRPFLTRFAVPAF